MDKKSQPENMLSLKICATTWPLLKQNYGHLRGNRLEGYHFRRQQIIEPYIADFYCHQAALIIEIDGAIHQYKLQEDKIRETYLKENGYHVLRFTNQQIFYEMEHVLNKILEILSH